MKAEGKEEDFLLTGSKGEQWRGRTLLLATGVARYHPTVDGDFTPCFGYAGKGNLFYCTDCEGPELFGKDTIVIGAGPADWAAAMAVGLSRYTERLRVLLTGGRDLSEHWAARLRDRGIPVIAGEIKRLIGGKRLLEGRGAPGRDGARGRRLLRLQPGAGADRPRRAARGGDGRHRIPRQSQDPARRHQRARRLDRRRPAPDDPAGRGRHGDGQHRGGDDRPVPEEEGRGGGAVGAAPPAEYDPSVRRQTILLAFVLCTCAACAGGRAPAPRTAPAEPRTAPAGPKTALDVLRAREPGTEWDGKSLLHADLDLDGGEDYALDGLRKDRFVVGIVHGPLTGDRRGDSGADSQVWIMDFPWDGGEDALCSKDAKITLEPLEENEGPKPGHPREGMGINLSDEQCDAFHIYWNPQEKTFE